MNLYIGEKRNFFKNLPQNPSINDFKELCLYDRQRRAFSKYDFMNSFRNKEEYTYNNFFLVFRNIKFAQDNPSFYNDVFNYITQNNPQQIEEVKKYISGEILKDDPNGRENTALWFEKLDTIRQSYLEEKNNEGRSI